MHHSLEKNPRLTPLRIGRRLKLLVEIFIELCPSYANVTVSTVFSGFDLTTGVDLAPLVIESPRATTTRASTGASTITAVRKNRLVTVSATGIFAALTKFPKNETYAVWAASRW
jgi:hypothetical protein